MLQLHEVHDKVINKNFLSQPQGKSSGQEVNHSSFKARKNRNMKQMKGEKKVVAGKVKPSDDNGKTKKKSSHMVSKTRHAISAVFGDISFESAKH